MSDPVGLASTPDPAGDPLTASGTLAPNGTLAQTPVGTEHCVQVAFPEPAGSSEAPNHGPVEKQPCSHCGAPARYLCSHCAIAAYCSRACQQSDWPNHSGLAQRAAAEQSPAQQASAEDDEDDGPTAEDLMFYLEQIFLVTKPVVVCILLSVFWVKMTMQPDGTTLPSVYSSITPVSGSTAAASAINGLVQAAIILGNIVVATIIIVFLFIRGYIKFLMGFFGLVVTMLLGYFGFYLIYQLFSVWNVAIDWVTVAFLLFNSTLVGVMAIFWRAPKALQQAYLVLMCTLMAYTLTGLPEWTAWIFMALLVVWDLVAVLCPFGPLRLLIENAREAPQNTRPLQALMYSAMVWVGMIQAVSPDADAPAGETPLLAWSNASSSRATLRVHPHATKVPTTDPTSPASNLDTLSQSSDRSSVPLLPSATGAAAPAPTLSAVAESRGEPSSPGTLRPEEPVDPDQARDAVQEEAEEAERSGLKLGLGDFVFYSLLVSRAAMYDWITTVACIIAVLSGLDATIFLLAMLGKALPALPISLTVGIIFYFVSRIMMTPFFAVGGLVSLVLPDPTQPLAGITAGMVYI